MQYITKNWHQAFKLVLDELNDIMDQESKDMQNE